MLPSLKPDEKEACKLQRKKENLEKIKARLLNPRLRVFGVSEIPKVIASDVEFKS